MSVDQLKEWARRVRPDLPSGLVIDALVQNYRGPGTVFSPAAISKQFRAEQAPVLDTLLLLAGEPRNILKGHWIFFDDFGDQYELSAEEVRQTVASGEFYHPLTGARVFSYGRSIGLVYEAGPRFDELLAVPRQ